MKRVFIILFLSFGLINCASTTEEGVVGIDRKQFFAISSEQVNEMSYQQYAQVKAEAQKKGVLDKNPIYLSRVQAVAKRIIPHTAAFKEEAPSWDWEAHVITSPELNAYCMPGGKIMFYSNIIEKLQLTDAEIAAIMGHEISHALREHGRERVSRELVKSGALQVGVLTGKVTAQQAQIVNAALTVGLLHYDRTQETEADEMGLELMARAGYDPHAALSLWKKMAAASGGSKAPTWLSTHPSDSERMENLESLLPKVMPLYNNSATKS